MVPFHLNVIYYVWYNDASPPQLAAGCSQERVWYDTEYTSCEDSDSAIVAHGSAADATQCEQFNWLGPHMQHRLAKGFMPLHTAG